MYERELEKLKSLYQDGIFNPDFYSKKLQTTSFDNYENFQKNTIYI